jgi:hypothetical protein
MSRKHPFACIGLAVGVSIAAFVAAGQGSYPTKPIKIIAPVNLAAASISSPPGRRAPVERPGQPSSSRTRAAAAASSARRPRPRSARRLHAHGSATSAPTDQSRGAQAALRCR